MKALLLKIKKFVHLFRAMFPSALPNGMSEFDTWANDIIDLYNFPNNDSIRFALASMIMHSGPTDAYKSKFYFSLMIKSSMAKQIAGAQFQEIKNRQKAEQEALAAKAALDAASNENKQ